MYLPLNFLVLRAMIGNTTLNSLFINCGATSVFCQHAMHDSAYDTFTLASLKPFTMHTFF
jgi:hypothetical protein